MVTLQLSDEQVATLASAVTRMRADHEEIVDDLAIDDKVRVLALIAHLRVLELDLAIQTRRVA